MGGVTSSFDDKAHQLQWDQSIQAKLTIPLSELSTEGDRRTSRACIGFLFRFPRLSQTIWLGGDSTRGTHSLQHAEGSGIQVAEALRRMETRPERP